jgi:hypothetical protein
MTADCHLLTRVSFGILLPLLGVTGQASAQEPFVAQANQILRTAGLPGIPEKATEVRCYAWSGLSAGVYATFVLEKAELDPYVALFPKNLEKLSPIPQAFLNPPNSAAPWFTPSEISNGQIWLRGQIVRAAPEMVRFYIDPEKPRIFLYYTWNNKRTYP